MQTIDASTREAAGAFLERIQREFPVSHAVLFGSRARHDHRPDSDADIAVFLTGEADAFVRTTLAMADIAYDVLLDTGVLIQPLPIWEQEWEHPDDYVNPRLLAKIRRDGVTL